MLIKTEANYFETCNCCVYIQHQKLNSSKFSTEQFQKEFPLHLTIMYTDIHKIQRYSELSYFLLLCMYRMKKKTYMGKYCGNIGNLLIYLPSGQFIPLMITYNFVYMLILAYKYIPTFNAWVCICVGILSYRYYVYSETKHTKKMMRKKKEEVEAHKSSVSSQEAIKLI